MEKGKNLIYFFILFFFDFLMYRVTNIDISMK